MKRTFLLAITSALMGLVVALAFAAMGLAGSAKTKRVSVSWAGAQADDRSHDASISAGGRYVAFASYASNLVRHEPPHGRLRPRTAAVSS